MSLTPTQIAVLRTELQNDPRGYGYNSTARNDADMALRINTVRDGTNPPSSPTADGGVASGLIKINNPSVSTALIRSTVSLAAFGGLVTVNQAYLEWITNEGALSVNAALLQNLAGIPTANSAIWAAGDRVAMNAALEAIMRHNGSRAEEKFGAGVTVTIDDVSRALNS